MLTQLGLAEDHGFFWPSCQNLPQSRVRERERTCVSTGVGDVEADSSDLPINPVKSVVIHPSLMKTAAGRYRGSTSSAGWQSTPVCEQKGALVLPAHLHPPLPHSLTEANVLLAAPQQHHKRFVSNDIWARARHEALWADLPEERRFPLRVHLAATAEPQHMPGLCLALATLTTAAWACALSNAPVLQPSTSGC